MSTLHHALFTNAAGADGRGFRFVSLTPSWPQPDRRRLEAWLRAFTVEDVATPVTTCAVNSLRLGGTIHACLAAADGDFGADAYGRPARLTHALLTPLDEARPADDWGTALLALRRAFVRPAGPPNERLDPYLARCATQRERPREAPDRGRGAGIDDDMMRSIFAAAATSARVLTLASASADDVAALLVRVTALLPPRLRLAFRWTLELGTVAQATTVQVADNPAAGPHDPRADAFVRWLRAGGGASVVSGWGIRSWDELMTTLAIAETNTF